MDTALGYSLVLAFGPLIILEDNIYVISRKLSELSPLEWGTGHYGRGPMPSLCLVNVVGLFTVLFVNNNTAKRKWFNVPQRLLGERHNSTINITSGVHAQRGPETHEL